jgi:hypothetical protein
MVKNVLCTLLTLASLLAASLPATAQSRDAFLELSADKAEVYVQEQLILSVQLYFSGALVQGELSEPSHPNAIIERLGSQRESVQFRDGVRYQVIERRYAIFPQRPGTLTLPAIHFEGHVRDSSRRLQAVKDRQQLYDVPVKPIPDAYPANTPWLPARDVTLTSDGLPASKELEAGRNLTRQLTLEVNGLPAEALPAFPQTGSPAIRQYPDQPERHTQASPDGLQGILQQSFALVPVEAGPASVPELTVYWWNTQTDRLEQAALPARNYQISSSQPSLEAPAPADTPTMDAEDAPGTNKEADNHDMSVWFWSTLLFAGLWLATLVLWWRTRGPADKARRKPAQQTHETDKQAYERLIQAIKDSSPRTSALLVHWAIQKYAGKRFVTTQDVLRYLRDAELEAALTAFEESLFSMKGQDQPVPKAQRERLIQAIEKTKRGNAGTTKPTGLPPLYPPGLSG